MQKSCKTGYLKKPTVKKSNEEEFKRCKICGKPYWMDKNEEVCPICKEVKK